MYCMAVASTSGDASARACSSQATSTRPAKGAGRRRTHVVEATVAATDGSAKRRVGPVTATDRAPSVKVATHEPAPSRTSVRDGLSARVKVY
jgi:hypothetical protein